MENKNSFRNHPLYKISLWIALASSLLLLWQMNKAVLSNTNYIPIDDFSHYWASGKLNIRGANPYDPEQVQSVRNTIVGDSAQYDTIPINWTPPWSLFFLMPYGIFDYPISRLGWLITHVAVLLVCVNLVWKIYAGKPKFIAFAWGVTFIFGPTISVLEKGQITSLVLLGIVGFLYFSSYRQKSFTAGLFIVLIGLKPQLVYLFWPAILFWILQKKDWKMAGGGITGLMGALLIASIWNPGVTFDYVNALRIYPPADWATPTLGGYLRLIFGTDNFTLQFAAPVIGFIWFLYYWQRNKKVWKWEKFLPVILFASILTTPYAWTYDQVVLLPAVLLIGILIEPKRKDNISIIIWISYLGINLLDLFLHRYFSDFWFGWLAPAYLIWFLVAYRNPVSNILDTAS